MEKSQYKIELNDLPFECVAEILKRVKSRAHRNDARLVCKFWCHLINSDSSSECYLLNQRTTGHDDDRTQPQFTNFISEFLNFNRKKISFRFDNINLQGTEHFWNEKGARIIGLNFENLCQEIPLERVFSKCIRLREMFIKYSADKIINALESLTAEKFCNYSLNFLSITNFPKEITVEMAIQLVQLVSNVFPRIRKVTLSKFAEINGWNYKELSKKFVQLKCELELNSDSHRIVFDSSSETPISVRKVTTRYWTMEPYEYYKNLEEITYLNRSHRLQLFQLENISFRLSQLESIFSQYPKLQTLIIAGGFLVSDLRKPIPNRLNGLYLRGEYQQEFTISSVFLDTFQFLKIFYIDCVPLATFTDILLNMQHLEELKIENSITMADECAINNELEVLVHENLKLLTIPLDFLPCTRTIYRFDNLTEITILQLRILPAGPNVDEVLQRFRCPNLKRICLREDMITCTSVGCLWMKNLMSMFPKLESYFFLLYGSEDIITEDQKLALRQICPKLHIRDLYTRGPPGERMMIIQSSN